MSYDYSSSSNRLNLPNPLKIENIFLLCTGFMLLAVGVYLLFLLRTHFSDASKLGLLVCLLASLGLLLLSISLIGRAFTQLRFYFGRGRPKGLAPDLSGDQQGNPPEAEPIKETLRQQALVYHEPAGPLNNLLYSFIPNLIFSPQPVQALAQDQFKNAISMAALLVSFAIALIGGKIWYGGTEWEQTAGWIGFAYLVYANLLLFKPTQLGTRFTRAREIFTAKGLVLLILFSVLGPVLIAMVAPMLPQLTWFSPFPLVFVVLTVPLVTYALFFVALLRQLRQPPETTVSRIQEAWNINCHPALAIGEFDRMMQDEWREKIPNRRYVRVDPTIDLNSRTGQFVGEVFEETQPFPVVERPITFGEAIRNSRYSILVVLNVLGMLAYLACGVAAIIFVNGVLDWNNSQYVGTTLAYAFVFGGIGSYAFNSAHALWLRFDFNSYLIWLELNGQYISATMEHGNLMVDSIRTSSNVTQVESMTFRLWVAAVESVAFGKDADRFILSLRGDGEYCGRLASHLRNFTQSQAVIVAPKAGPDLQRHAALSQMNLAARNPEETTGPTAANVVMLNEQTSDKPSKE